VSKVNEFLAKAIPPEEGTVVSDKAMGYVPGIGSINVREIEDDHHFKFEVKTDDDEKVDIESWSPARVRDLVTQQLSHSPEMVVEDVKITDAKAGEAMVKVRRKTAVEMMKEAVQKDDSSSGKRGSKECP
jgi:hypothetical protein